jgi:glycerophosphoryl diester phosphodiesterase
MTPRCLSITVFLLICSFTTLQAGQNASLIYSSSSHRGLSLPALILVNLEHPDFIELPVVLTSDNKLLVYDARVLQLYTNVAEIFPQRQRDDGNFYVIDFTLAEIEQLSYSDLSPNTPTHDVPGHPTSLNNALHILSKVSTAAGTSFRPILVIKYPWFHSRENRDISRTLLDNLPERFRGADTTLYLKCFDPDELQRIANTLQKEFAGEMELIQGIDYQDGGETNRWKRGEWVSYNDEWFFTRIGLRVAAGYADALALADIHRVDASTLHRFLEDSHSLDLSVFLSVPKDTFGTTTGTRSTIADDAVASHDTSIFELGADGFLHSEVKKLRCSLTTQQQSTVILPLQKLQSGQLAPLEHGSASNVKKDHKDGTSALLSSPATLREKLQNMQ